jgi:hypothetical protein
MSDEIYQLEDIVSAVYPVSTILLPACLDPNALVNSSEWDGLYWAGFSYGGCYTYRVQH